MNLSPELIAFIEEAFPHILPEIPTDDYSHEDDVLFGVVLGIMYAKGWRQRLNAEERTYVYGYIEGFLNNIHDEDAGNGSLVYKEESNFIF